MNYVETLVTIGATLVAYELLQFARRGFGRLSRDTREACYIVTGILAIGIVCVSLVTSAVWYKSRSIAASLESLGELEVVEIATPFLNVETGDYAAVQMTLRLADGNESRFHVYNLSPHNLPHVGDRVRLTTSGRFSWLATLQKAGDE